MRGDPGGCLFGIGCIFSLYEQISIAGGGRVSIVIKMIQTKAFPSSRLDQVFIFSSEARDEA